MTIRVQKLKVGTNEKEGGSERRQMLHMYWFHIMMIYFFIKSTVLEKNIFPSAKLIGKSSNK